VPARDPALLPGPALLVGPAHLRAHGRLAHPVQLPVPGPEARRAEHLQPQAPQPGLRPAPHPLRAPPVPDRVVRAGVQAPVVQQGAAPRDPDLAQALQAALRPWIPNSSRNGAKRT